MMKSTFALAFMTLFLSATARAALLVEPYGGYAFGGSISGGSLSSSQTVTGVEYGGRIGFQRMGFQLGAEYLGGQMDFKYDNINYKLTQTDFGPFIGYQSLAGFRIYGTYFISPTAVDNQSPSTTFKNAWAGKIGIGYKFARYASINFEYYTSQFSKYTSSGVTSSLTSKLDANYYMVTLSFPLTFL
jgi:opacity protein-like surface antigen